MIQLFNSSWMAMPGIAFSTWVVFSLLLLLYSLYAAEYEKPGQQLG